MNTLSTVSLTALLVICVVVLVAGILCAARDKAARDRVRPLEIKQECLSGVIGKNGC